MIRAIFFDFYSVWLPNPFTPYLEMARQRDPILAGELEAAVGKYFQGEVDAEYVADTIRVKMNQPDVTAERFLLKESDISPEVGNFMRELHSHFVKLGILANLGVQEYRLLNDFNEHNQLFEAITGPMPLGFKMPLLSQEVFAAALQQIGEPPRSCLAVTGDQTYQRFAEGLGMATLAFQGLPTIRQIIDEELTREIPE